MNKHTPVSENPQSNPPRKTPRNQNTQITSRNHGPCGRLLYQLTASQYHCQPSQAELQKTNNKNRKSKNHQSAPTALTNPSTLQLKVRDIHPSASLEPQVQPQTPMSLRPTPLASTHGAHVSHVASRDTTGAVHLSVMLSRYGFGVFRRLGGSAF